jgi:hypothetical protein
MPKDDSGVINIKYTSTQYPPGYWWENALSGMWFYVDGQLVDSGLCNGSRSVELPTEEWIYVTGEIVEFAWTAFSFLPEGYADNTFTAYIDDMEEKLSGSRYVYNWQDDLKMLKHYRWLRNQIAHEIDVNEDDSCTKDDIEWINGFYDRIMKQEDPLALYRKATQEFAVKQQKTQVVHTEDRDVYKLKHDITQNKQKAKGKDLEWNKIAICVILIIAIILILYYNL